MSDPPHGRAVLSALGSQHWALSTELSALAPPHCPATGRESPVDSGPRRHLHQPGPDRAGAGQPDPRRFHGPAAGGCAVTKTGVTDTGSSIWPSRPRTVRAWPNTSVTVAVA